jgi:hypothetical protein
MLTWDWDSGGDTMTMDSRAAQSSQLRVTRP